MAGVLAQQELDHAGSVSHPRRFLDSGSGYPRHMTHFGMGWLVAAVVVLAIVAVIVVLAVSGGGGGGGGGY